MLQLSVGGRDEYIQKRSDKKRRKLISSDRRYVCEPTTIPGDVQLGGGGTALFRDHPGHEAPGYSSFLCTDQVSTSLLPSRREKGQNQKDVVSFVVFMLWE
jgi:hypothetical protein